MSSGIDAPDARLVLPEGYVAERAESGRLTIYVAETGAWVCEVNPNLSNAQEMVEGLLTAHENEVLRIRRDPDSY